MRLLIVLVLAAGCHAKTVVEGPPPQREEVVLYRPGYIWVQGNFVHLGNAWVWRGGHYERERPSHVFVQGQWERHGTTYVWVPGGWRPRGRVVVHGR